MLVDILLLLDRKRQIFLQQGIIIKINLPNRNVMRRSPRACMRRFSSAPSIAFPLAGS
jgi:hypothetical protein